MIFSRQQMSQPHFATRDAASTPATESDLPRADRIGAGGALGPLLMRTAECLTALVQGPTVQAGLNESRYRVLDVLRRKTSGTCSQTELATQLLQSESNLSTLLERMRKDGLISRVRSESDRRVALIGLSQVGAAALDRAEPARSRAMASVLRVLDEDDQETVCKDLRLLLQTLERALGLSGRPPRRTGATLTSNAHPS